MNFMREERTRPTSVMPSTLLIRTGCQNRRAVDLSGRRMFQIQDESTQASYRHQRRSICASTREYLRAVPLQSGTASIHDYLVDVPSAELFDRLVTRQTGPQAQLSLQNFSQLFRSVHRIPEASH